MQSYVCRAWFVSAFALAIAGCGASSEEHLVALSTPEDTALSIPMPLIPELSSAKTATFTVTTEPQHGTIEGTFPSAIYTPETDFNGDDELVVRVEDSAGTFEVTLQITVTSSSDAPIANADVIAGTEDTVQMIAAATLLANDADGDGDTLTLTGVGTVYGGTAVLEGGNIKFTPKLDVNGSASVVYMISDGQTSANGVLTISLDGTADAPVAVDDGMYTEQNIPITIQPDWLTGNDTDADRADTGYLTVTAVSNAQNGTAVLQADGTVTFTPATDFIGDATFTYTVSDRVLTDTALCTVTVAAPPPPTVAP